MRKLASLLAGLLLVSGLAFAQNTELALAEGDAGHYLVDVDGQALYLFLPDNQRFSTCNDECLTDWEPVELVGGIAIGEGLSIALVGTIERDDGTIQVTYNLWPLYRYAGDDNGAPQAHGLGDSWYLVTGEGNALGLETDGE